MFNYITKSLLSILKSKCPKTDSCGTAERTSKGKGKLSKMLTVVC